MQAGTVVVVVNVLAKDGLGDAWDMMDVVIVYGNDDWQRLFIVIGGSGSMVVLAALIVILE
jgi:hypothetical protein